MSGISYIIDDAELQRLVEATAGRISRNQPALDAIGSLAEESIKTNFKVGGRPPWKAVKYRSGTPLRDTGRLMGSITKQVAGNVVMVGTGEKYAAIHNFGGTIKQGAHSRLYVQDRHTDGERKGKFKKGTTRGRGFTFGDKTITIPQREFMLLQDEDLTDINKLLENWIIEGRL